ncbi:MAG TPA: hypothetical protein ENI14_01845 [Thermoplasmatales archaeon]|nr:MAG: hypothetical protein DRN09_00550 [Thermoplasmata archaeon]HDD57723.1 hypothetical protein [Thermoplasmatales archaeon]HEB37390.1 hypothetical protein [Thermoplasmatales archaeon]
MVKRVAIGKIPLTGLFSIKQEILLTPVIVSVPIAVSLLFIYSSVVSGFFYGNAIIGITILAGNLVFDIPFLKSFFRLRKK